jgi:hypothetical protein
MPKDTASETIKAIHSLLPQSLQVGANEGAGVDCRGFDEALIVVAAGVVTGSGSHAFKVQESGDNAVADAYADVTDAAFTAITASNDNTVYVGRVNLRERQRYLRVLDTGGVAVMEGAAVIILMAAAILPVTQVNDVEFSV